MDVQGCVVGEEGAVVRLGGRKEVAELGSDPGGSKNRKR